MIIDIAVNFVGLIALVVVNRFTTNFTSIIYWGMINSLDYSKVVIAAISHAFVFCGIKSACAEILFVLKVACTSISYLISLKKK